MILNLKSKLGMSNPKTFESRTFECLQIDISMLFVLCTKPNIWFALILTQIVVRMYARENKIKHQKTEKQRIEASCAWYWVETKASAWNQKASNVRNIISLSGTWGLQVSPEENVLWRRHIGASTRAIYLADLFYFAFNWICTFLSRQSEILKSKFYRNTPAQRTQEGL